MRRQSQDRSPAPRLSCPQALQAPPQGTGPVWSAAARVCRALGEPSSHLENMFQALGAGRPVAQPSVQIPGPVAPGRGPWPALGGPLPHPRWDGGPHPCPWAWGRRQWRCSDATPKPSKPQCEDGKGRGPWPAAPSRSPVLKDWILSCLSTEPQRRGLWHGPKEMGELSGCRISLGKC